MRKYVEDQTRLEVQMEVLYEVFKVAFPQSITTEERCLTKRKINPTELLDINPKRKSIFPQGNKTQGGGVVD